MSKKLRTEAVDHLFDAILCLKDREECYTFFEDVCTVNELLSLSQRFEVAKMLRDQRTYLDIAEKTGASTATISRVNRSLNYGNDGYDMVFNRLEEEESSGNQIERKGFSVVAENPFLLYFSLVLSVSFLLDLPISIKEAISGAKITIPTINGKVAVTVPAFSSSGEKLRLKGQGIKAKSGQGDEIVNLQIVLPKDKSAELSAAAEKMENYAVRSF